MKIEDLREKKHNLEFCDLTEGDVFKRVVPYGADWTFMKISKVTKVDEDSDSEIDDYNAVCLDDGDLVWFDWNEAVVKVGAKVVIENNEE